MGLDSVELVMRTENAFGIELPDAEMEKVRTPRDLIEQVCRRLDLDREPQCQSQQAFHRLRKGLMEVLGVPREQVRLETSLADLAPVDDCRPWWLRLRDHIGARNWPELVRPKWMRRGIGWITFAVYTATIALLCAWKGVAGLGQYRLLGLLAAGVADVLMHAGTRKFFMALPPEITTVSGLILSSLSAPGIVWNREGVAMTVKALIMDHLGIPDADYSVDKRFIGDYG